jgi:hypothetical protein
MIEARRWGEYVQQRAGAASRSRCSDRIRRATSEVVGRQTITLDFVLSNPRSRSNRSSTATGDQRRRKSEQFGDDPAATLEQVPVERSFFRTVTRRTVFANSGHRAGGVIKLRQHLAGNN